MLKRKAFNRIFLTTVIFFVVFVIYSFNIDFSREPVKKNHNNVKESIYTLNGDNYVSKTEVYVDKVFTLKDKIKEKIEIMIKNNNKNSLLPSYFKPILPKNTRILDVNVEDSLVKLNFSKELNNISSEQSEQMIEAIVYTITDENILGIEIYVEGDLLKYVPHTKKELPTVLTKDYGINKSYAVTGTIDITKIVMMYLVNCDGDNYEVPVTKYLNDKREKLEIIFDNSFDPVVNSNMFNVLENIKLLGYKIDKDYITINLSRDFDEEEVNFIISSIASNYDVKKVNILVNNRKKLEKTIEK